MAPTINLQGSGMGVRWDIFCRVIDNFGDIGVSWRLARQLVAEHNLDVRLWVDDLNTFCRLCPQASPHRFFMVMLLRLYKKQLILFI